MPRSIYSNRGFVAESIRKVGAVMKKSALIVILIAVFNYLPVFFAHHEPTQGASPNEKPTHLTAIMELISAGLAKPVYGESINVEKNENGVITSYTVNTGVTPNGTKYEIIDQNNVSSGRSRDGPQTLEEHMYWGKDNLKDGEFEYSGMHYLNAYEMITKSKNVNKDLLLEAITGQIFSYTGLKQYDEAFKKINETKVKFSESYMKQLFEKDPSAVIDYYHSVAEANYRSGNKDKAFEEGYLVPVKKFGEDKWLNATIKTNNLKYLDSVGYVVPNDFNNPEFWKAYKKMAFN